jgi:SpoVK/Ycf46/Vps4 family AAA+-type ATPase
VLWIDEIEKAFSGGDNDGGVSTRILGTFLSWLQERRGDVFVIATANDIARLPAELVRKGRFDEIFFVDLPDAEIRESIFRLHLQRRKQPIDAFNLPALAAAADGFSGAEIEQVVVSALYGVFATSRTLGMEDLSAEIARTRPLSATMEERIQGLRDWSRGRTVSAH